MPIVQDLIYDLGAHDGDDTDFYLRKGFRVVAVEANPHLASRLADRFAGYVPAVRAQVVGKAFAAAGRNSINLFVRDDKTVWSSIFQNAAERDGVEAQVCQVDVVTVRELIEKFGVPRYIKIDLEGAEVFVLDQIASELDKPPFVSVELFSPETIRRLDNIGYDRFQMINQGYLGLCDPPLPAREGCFAEQALDGNISGLFGLELGRDRWVDRREAERQLMLWRDLRARCGGKIRHHVLKKIGKWTRRGWLIGAGWMDVHAGFQFMLD